MVYCYFISPIVSKLFLFRSSLRVQIITVPCGLFAVGGENDDEVKYHLELYGILKEHVMSPNLPHLNTRIKYQETFCWQIFRLWFGEHPNFFCRQTTLIKKFPLNSSFSYSVISLVLAELLLLHSELDQGRIWLKNTFFMNSYFLLCQFTGPVHCVVIQVLVAAQDRNV